jgi:Mn-dependent DtxR family transcriptional regulator
VPIKNDYLLFITNFLKENENIKSGDLANHLSISLTRSKEILRELVADKFLTPIGNNRNRIYILNT